MRFVEIQNISQPLNSPIHAGICETFIQKLRGLMFYPSITLREGRLFIEKEESKLNASIHMLFMKFDITVVWIDRKFEVVDVILAKQWRPYYFPALPAQYTLELHASRLSEFHVGDKLLIKND